MVNKVNIGRSRINDSIDDRDPGPFTISVALSENTYANGDDSNDQNEYVQVFDSTIAGFSGFINGAETLQASFPPVYARFIKVQVSNGLPPSVETCLDEVEIFMEDLGGLVAYYPFEGDASDTSGNGLHGTAYGDNEYVKGVCGQAMYFDGDGDYVEIDWDALLENNDLTFSCWVSMPEPQINRFIVMPSHEEGDKAFYFNYDHRPATGRIWLQTYFYRDQFVRKTDLDLTGGFHHLSFTKNASEVKIYVDGSLIQSGSVNEVLNYGFPRCVLLGADDYYNSDCVPDDVFFKGIMDEVRIYSRALSEAEIQELYQECNDGLVAYYPFDGDANDARGNGNDGIEFGGPSYVENECTQAISLDGQNDYVELQENTNLDGFSAFTISLWIKPDTDLNESSGRQDFLYKGQNCYECSSYTLNYDDGGTYEGMLTFFLHGANYMMKQEYRTKLNFVLISGSMLE